MTHSRKSPRLSLAAFVEAVAPALGFSALQPWQRRVLEAIGARPRSDLEALLRGPGVGRPLGLLADWSPRKVGLDLGAGETVALVGVRGRDGRIMIDHVEPLPPSLLHGSPGRRFGEIIRASRELEAQAAWIMAGALARQGLELKLKRRSERMRYEAADLRRPGSGRRALEGRIRAVYRWRAAYFGEEWKLYAAEYARLQALHADLYGEPVPYHRAREGGPL